MKMTFLKSVLFISILFIGCETTPKRTLIITDPLQRDQYEFVKNREECWRYAKGIQERLRDRYQKEKSTSFAAGYLQGMNIARSYQDAFRECMAIKGYRYKWKHENIQ